VKDKTTKLKDSLESLNMTQLKSLAKKHNIKVKGTVEESFFETHRKAPTKKQYISKLKRIVTEKEINSIRKQVKKKKKRKKEKNQKIFGDSNNRPEENALIPIMAICQNGLRTLCILDRKSLI